MKHFTAWNPQNGYVPKVNEQVRLIGNCDRRLYNKVVTVTKVWEEDGEWWFECRYSNHGQDWYTSGMLGGLEPVK